MTGLLAVLAGCATMADGRMALTAEELLQRLQRLIERNTVSSLPQVEDALGVRVWLDRTVASGGRAIAETTGWLANGSPDYHYLTVAPLPGADRSRPAEAQLRLRMAGAPCLSLPFISRQLLPRDYSITLGLDPGVQMASAPSAGGRSYFDDFLQLVATARLRSGNEAVFAFNRGMTTAPPK